MCGGSGGSATQSELIYGRIRALAKQTKTPVYTFAEDVAASGAYAPHLHRSVAVLMPETTTAIHHQTTSPVMKQALPMRDGDANISSREDLLSSSCSTNKAADRAVIPMCRYWLLLAGDEVYANKTSLVGSIGVINATFGAVEAIKRLGIERRVYTAGKYKDLLDPFRRAPALLMLAPPPRCMHACMKCTLQRLCLR